MNKVVSLLGALLLFLSLDGQTVITLHLPLPCTETSITTNGELTLVASGRDILGDLHLEISTIQGKTMVTNHFASSENQFSKTLDLSHLASGVYMLKLTNKEAIVTKKIIIQK